MSQNTVADKSPSVAAQEEKRTMVRAIMGGTEHLRSHKEYLPQHPAESNGVYEQRKKRTFLHNFIDLAIQKAVGKLFAREVEVSDAPAEIENLLENIDRQGRALTPFLMDVAEVAFQDGISFVLVDMPRNPGARTLAEERGLGLRPYAIHIKPESLLEALAEVVNGEPVLTRVRIKETITEQSSAWDYSVYDQIRVWYREPGPVVRWEIYRQQGEKKEWVMVEEGFTSVKSIYLIPFYTNRTGYMEGEPPFQTIAEKNIEHWQWKSEHAHALSMCCFGMYTATGVPEEFEFKVGPAKTQTCTSPDAKFGILETTGKGVTLAENTLKSIEDSIDQAGVNLRVENAGQVTATAAALDSEETAATLKAIAKGFSDAAEYMLQAFAEILGLDTNKAGEVSVNDDFGAKKGSDAGLVEIGKARALGDISRRAYLHALQWHGELPEDFDMDANDEELSAEGPALGMIGGGDNQDASV